MANLFQNCNFSVDPVDVGLIFNFVFFQYFDCNFVASYNMGALLNFSKGSLALGFANDEASNLLAFTIFLLFWVVSILLELRLGVLLFELIFLTVRSAWGFLLVVGLLFLAILSL